LKAGRNTATMPRNSARMHLYIRCSCHNSGMVASPHDDLLSMYATYLNERGYQVVKVAETTKKTPTLRCRETGTFT
jgi:hypothetical protein